MSLARLAAASGLASPAYVLHIENGSKVPSRSVASRIATALGLDPVLLEAWAAARSRGDLETVLSAAATLQARLGAPSPATAPWAVDSAGVEARERVVAAAAEGATAPGTGFRVPVLAEGSDPDAGADSILEWLDLDARLFPPGLTPDRPFAYRLTAHGARRLPDLVRPGDCAVLIRCDDVSVAEAAYAVRAGARVELSRLAWVEDRWFLVEGGAPREPLRGDPREALAGRLVLAVRRWL